MIEIRGAFGMAKVFTDTLEPSAAAQIQTLCDQPYAAGSRIRIMPDVHAGMGCTIGTTMTLSDTVVPNLVGVDIGCGMETALLSEKRMEPARLDRLIHEKIPSGFRIREKPHRLAEEIDLSALHCVKQVNTGRAARSIGTLGGGNHFIEASRDDEDGLYIVLHSGSRHLGVEVASYYQREGYKRLGGKKQPIPQSLAYIGGELFEQYIHDMRIVQRFAALNRRAMLEEIVRGMKADIVSQITTIHNYIDTDAMVLRKGAVSARAGEALLVPINMRDGSLLCEGLGNADWNESAPHGAGRLYSRSAAKQTFTVAQFQKEMEGVFTTTLGRDTLDECPMAYKPMEAIVEAIGPTAKIRKRLRPIYNFKAGGD